MHIIAKSKDHVFGFNQFLKDVCEKTRYAIENNKTLTHCILIYSRANPVISKILNDDYFYEALDEITGRFLNIYHAESKREVKSTKPSNDLFTIGRMVAINNFNIYSDKEENSSIINQMNQLFHLNVNNHNPMLLFFHVDKNDIKDSFSIEIEEIGKEATFIELRKIISNVVESVKEVTDDNVKNQLEIFNLVETKLKQYRMVKRVEKIAKNPLLNIALALK